MTGILVVWGRAIRRRTGPWRHSIVNLLVLTAVDVGLQGAGYQRGDAQFIIISDGQLDNILVFVRIVYRYNESRTTVTFTIHVTFAAA